MPQQYLANLEKLDVPLGFFYLIKSQFKTPIRTTMNIKTLSPSLTAVDRELKSAELKKSVKSENTSADRDPNGKRERDEGKDPEQKQFLTDEEIEKALETLKNFDGIKDSYLKVELVVNEISRHVLITDPQGKVVRRIPESELWPLIQPKESEKKGHLLDKAG